jgi:hypothetical protein
VLKLRSIIIVLAVPFISFAQNTSFLNEIGHFQKAHAFSLNDTGSLFVLDKGTNEVIKLDSAGNVIKKIGGTGWDDYSFDNPVDICVTMLRIYVTDRNNSRIQVYDKDLNFLFSLDPKNFSSETGAFRYPVSAHASSYGDLYVVDSDNKQIIKFMPNWDYSNKFGNNESGKYSIADPIKLALDKSSNLFLLDGNKILVYDQFGNGILSYNLTDKPKNLSILNNFLILSYDKHILYSALKDNAKDGLKFEEMKFEPVKEIIDAIISDGKIYLLTENSIQIFKCRLLANNN